MTKSNKSKAPAAIEEPVVVTVTISPLKNGKRPLVISGAPAGEMPVVRTGHFSEIHSLFDEMWLELIKRKPKVVIKPAESKPAAGKRKDTADASADRDNTAGDAADEADEATDAETAPEDSGPAGAEAEFEQSVLEAKAEADPELQEPDQLVRPEPEDAAVEPAEPLPLIEGDPTLAQA